MQTNNSNGEQSQNATVQQNNAPEIETNFLEFGKMQDGKHSIAIIKESNKKRGMASAEIFFSYEGEPKKPLFIAKDREGNNLFPPTDKLWQLKQSIKENAPSLLEKAKQISRKIKDQAREGGAILNEEAKEMGKETLKETHEFASVAKDMVHGNGRQNDLRGIRQTKVHKIKNTELER